MSYEAERKFSKLSIIRNNFDQLC